MDITGIQVKINNEEKCIYEHKIAQFDDKLETLLRNLRDVRSLVNNLLTTMIQQEDTSDIAQKTRDRLASSDVELDTEEEEEEEEEEEKRKDREEEVQVNSKKCKLSI